ncbi:putative ATPase/class 3 adenylate cyclase [Mycobacterium sp. URHB0021]
MSELLPVGTVTLLLADVEGSTRLWEAQPEQMSAAFALLDRTLAESVAAHDGARPVEQGEGDSFVIAFARASDAVACALDLQRAPLSPIRLRIGVHTGEVLLRDEGNYIGPTMNKAARLRDLGHGGQTLLSGATEEIVDDRLPLGAWLTDLGTHSLRGMARPERVVQLGHPDIHNKFPPLRTDKTVVAENLPAQLTSFIGRSEQIKYVQHLLADNRLVTLTGAGGAGKTRLALEIAAQMASGFREGAWFVDLAPISDPDAVAVAAARALGLPDQLGRTSVDMLVGFTADRHMLVVFDNCEQLLDASAELAVALLSGCPGLTLLATSREPIGITGEVTWRVPSLSIADEAIELFADRARRARPDFSMTDDDAATIMEICRHLDGMPLAIELAAARVRSLSLAEIIDGLRDRFRLLTGGGRTAMRRQQTLRASVDWSYALLTESERALFRRLAVFVGGFNLEAAHAVAGGGEMEPYKVLDQLTTLVDKSLVVAEENGARTRYRLLETVRQYALEKLGDSEDADAVRKRHRDYYMALVDLLLTQDRTAREHLQTAEGLVPAAGPAAPGVSVAGSEQAVNEMDNLRAAFAWSAELEPDPEVLVRAARGAAWLLDLPLADRLADAALSAGAGVQANVIRAHALSFLGRGHEADALLIDAQRMDHTELGQAGYTTLRAINRHFTLADPTGAKILIDQAAESAGRPARSVITAFLTVYWAAMGCPKAAEASSRLIAWHQIPDVAARATAWAITVALGDSGSTSAAVGAAEAGYAIPVRGYFVITDAHVGALLLAGRISDAQGEAQTFRRRVAVYASPQFDPIFAAVAGRSDLGAGRINTACVMLESAATTFAAMGEPQGWWYRAQLARTTALAVAGLAEQAAAALRALQENRHPGWRYLDYEYAIAQGWVAAGQGAIGKAITALLSAAAIAGANGQLAGEVVCLQTAVQFGDSSGAKRLSELALVVEGPRAGAVARFAAALSADDGEELALASNDFEIMGDLVAAIDAAAYAAISYRRQGLWGAALECATRAEVLGEQCGAMTPALRGVSDR